MSLNQLFRRGTNNHVVFLGISFKELGAWPTFSTFSKFGPRKSFSNICEFVDDEKSTGAEGKRHMPGFLEANHIHSLSSSHIKQSSKLLVDMSNLTRSEITLDN